MADYYLEYSQVLAHLSNEEFDWLTQQLEFVHAFDGREFAADSMSAGLDPEQAEWSGYRFYRDYEDDLPDAHDAGFCFELIEREDSDFGRHLWVYADDHGDLGPLAHLVQKILRRFRPDKSWSVTYATSCSKPRVDSFGGGAVFVTADEIKFDSAWDFVEREAAAIAASNASSG
jgi:hypothetical protein